MTWLQAALTKVFPNNSARLHKVHNKGGTPTNVFTGMSCDYYVGDISLFLVHVLPNGLTMNVLVDFDICTD